MNKIVTISLTVSSIGLFATGIIMSNSTSSNSIFSELHSLLSLVFAICFFIHVKKHSKNFITFKNKNNV